MRWGWAWVRIRSYSVIIAGFVTNADMVMHGCGANDGSLKKAAEKDHGAGAGKGSDDTAEEGGK